MSLQGIADMIRGNVEKSDFDERLKFDCGDDGVMVFADGTVSLDDQPATCTIKISTSDLEQLIKGKLNPMTGVMMGKLKVSGNPAVALKLGKLLG